MSTSNSRRKFLRYSTLAGLGLSLNPLSAFALEGKGLPGNSHEDMPLSPGQKRVTLLQTTDVH